jgi:uncharacterized protein YbaP (TraB family)
MGDHVMKKFTRMVARQLRSVPAAAALALVAATPLLAGDRADGDRAAGNALTALVPPGDGALVRFRTPLCAKVAAPDRVVQEAIVRQLEKRARELNLKWTSSACSPNMRVVVTTDRQIVLGRFLAHTPGARVSALTRSVVLDDTRNRLFVWIGHSGAAQDRQVIHYQNLRLPRRTMSDVDARATDATILPARAGQARLTGLLVIDAALAEGKTPEQLADYAAMRLLGNITDALPTAASILRLFAGEQRPASGLTDFDRYYLHRLYDAPSAATLADLRATLAATRVTFPDPAPRQASSTLRLPDERTAEIDGERTLEQEAGGDAVDPAPGPPAATPTVARSPGTEPAWGNDVVVTARREGPALWRVRNNGATIVILGSVSPLPAGFAWRDWRVKAAIRRSRLMLVSSEPEPNLVWMRDWGAADVKRLHQPKGRVLADELSPEDRRRFGRAAQDAGQVEDRYSGLRPAIASMLLYADWRDRSGLSNTRLSRELVRFGRAAHVRAQLVNQVSLLPTIDEVPALDDGAQQSCFRQLLLNVENERNRAAAQARAWEAGDLVALRRNYLAPASCAAAVLVDKRRRDAAVQAWTTLLLRRLNGQERTFAVIDIASLLRPDGILAKLAAAGSRIDTPRDEGE